MKGFSYIAIALCILSISLAQTCPAEDSWPPIGADVYARIKCNVYKKGSELLGSVTRKCIKNGNTATWGLVNEDGCRNEFPTDEYTAYVDIDYTMSPTYPTNVISDTLFNQHWAEAHGFATDAVTVYEKSQIGSEISLVSIRLVTTRTKGSELNNKLAESTKDQALVAKITSQSFNLKYQYWKSTTNTILSHEVTYRQSKSKNLLPVVLGVIFGFIILLVAIFVGFYVYIQMKRRTSKGGSTQLKASV